MFGKEEHRGTKGTLSGVYWQAHEDGCCLNDFGFRNTDMTPEFQWLIDGAINSQSRVPRPSRSQLVTS